MPDEPNSPDDPGLVPVPLHVSEPEPEPEPEHIDEDVARLTSDAEEEHDAESTDPSLFSIQADTRADVNIFQLKIAVVIALPFCLFYRPADGWQGIAAGILTGLVVGLLVSGLVLAIRYKRHSHSRND